MENNSMYYKSNAISLDVLSVLDVVEDGKVVSAKTWKHLWDLVFNSINGVDECCITIKTMFENVQQTVDALCRTSAELSQKYEALSKDLIHYGEDAPTNKDIHIWIKPLKSEAYVHLVTHAELETELTKAASKTAAAIKKTRDEIISEIEEDFVNHAEHVSYDNSKSGLESENIQDAIDELAMKTENTVSIDSWQGVQRIVDMGLAYKAFKIGDVLRCNHSIYGELSWDVVDATTERLSLCASKIIDTLEFDAREALYYAENGLTAGVYWFSLNVRPWYPDDSNKSFLFTLNNDVPVGGHLVLDVAHNAPLNGSNVIVYADANSTETLETAPITEGIGLTFLGYADGSTKNLNHIIRAILGSNSYKESAIRQWLNNDGEVGNAWTPQTIFDRPSYGAVRRPGFLNGLDKDFLEVISYAEYDTFQYGGGVTGRETLIDRFMLPSRSEIYAGAVGSNSSNIEGEPFPYFSQFSDHSSPSVNADTNRVKIRLKDNKAVVWWTRTPNVYSQYMVHTILTSGKLSDGNDAVNAWGVVPVCHIIKKTGGNADV